MTKDTENRGEGTSMERAEGDPSNVTESSSIVTGEGTALMEGSAEEKMALMRQKFLEESTLELISELDISEEVGRKVALAKCFGKLPLPKNRVKQILNGIWVLQGKWWMETLEPGLWGIFFKHEEDLKQVFEGRPWILGEWPECGRWQGVDMNLARVWVEIHGLPTPYLAVQNAPVIGAKVGTYVKFDKSDPRIIAWREYLKLMVEIDLTQRITAGFHLSINRGRKEWTAIGMLQRSCTADGDHPMAHVEKNPRDDGVILSLMPNVGPSSAQMLEHPHQKICKSRTPHQYPKPIPVEVELNVGIETTVAHLLGNEVDLKKGETIAIINEGDGLQAHITSGPGQKKRKASIPIIHVDSSGKVIHEDGSTNQSNITLPFSPASSPSFAVGKHDEDLSSGKRTKAGGSHGKKKGRRRKDSKTKENPTKGKGSRIFRFYEASLREQSCSEVIKETWEKNLNRGGADNLTLLLKNTKHALQGWRKQGFVDVDAKLRILEDRLMNLGELIIGIDIVNGLDRDTLVWKRVASGKFTVKEAYWLDNEGRFGPVLPGWRGAWFGSPLAVRSDEIQGNTILDKVVNLCKDSEGGSLEKILTCCYVVCDGIWRYRNSLVHGGKQMELGRFLEEANAKFEEFVSVQHDLVNAPSALAKGLVQVVPFNSNFIVTDGAFKDGWCGMAMMGNDS
ncbi:hypothetical protein F8388_008969 [Cannabis sativa]|uniref:DUF4283 domain-containing protein n=1 Tax=Cannabis sativa TaxID=3483 RepID=A0A7J6GFW9_CANSA|nr:hypothetical protein F8388_008969 [Cannabis sativa]